MSDSEPTGLSQIEPYGHDWWDYKISLHPPKNADVAHAMDTVRGWVRSLGNLVIDTIPTSPERTAALNALHEASMKAIAAIALHQDAWPDEELEA